MLESILVYLNNYFVTTFYGGTFTIRDGELDLSGKVADGQYYWIQGSLFNDGLHKAPESEMTDETFDGYIWAMAVPRTVIQLADEIKNWQDKYGERAASPFQSESFDGYSYSKSSGYGQSTPQAVGWQTAFAERLRRWRKIG